MTKQESQVLKAVGILAELFEAHGLGGKLARDHAWRVVATAERSVAATVRQLPAFDPAH